MVAKKLQSSTEGKFYAYVKYIAQELETFPKDMAMYCQRVINEAIFWSSDGFTKQNVACNNRTILFDTTATADRPTNNMPFR